MGSVPGSTRAFFARDLVLKSVDDETEAAWCAEVMADVIEAGFRVPRPIRSARGDWVVDGWTAWQRIAGVHDTTRRWKDVLDTCDAFHDALAAVARPSFLDDRTDPWSVGDRVAWGEASLTCRGPLGELLDRLMSFRREVASPCQVIHGDFGGNVLFEDGMAPGVIDFVPYFRPKGFASAIVVVDAIAWSGADESILRWVDRLSDLDQLLARAVIYRAVTVAVSYPADERRRRAEADAYRAILGLLGA